MADLANRDVVQISDIERGPEMGALIALLAARSGQLVAPHALANSLGLSQETVRRYLAMLEEVFLIKRIRAWSRNLSTRATGTAKVAMVDSGLAVSLTRQVEASLAEPTSPLGGLVEGLPPWRSPASGTSPPCREAGRDFPVGLVLDARPATVSFGPRLKAMPLSAIWEVGSR